MRWGVVIAASLVLACPAAAQPVLLSSRALFPNGCGEGPSISGADMETHVAVNPRDPANVVAAWIDGSGITNVVGSSRDGGRTWTESTVPGLRCTGDEGSVLSGDPWLSFGPDGIAYLAGGTDVGGGDPVGLDRFAKALASRSLDGGRTWSPAITVQTADDFNDKPAVTADPRRPGTAYMVFTRGHHPDFSAGDVLVAATHDGGATWSKPEPIYAPLAPGTYPWGSTLRVLPNGTLLVTVMLWNPQGLTTVNPVPSRFNFEAVAFRSTDGGGSWSAPIRIASVPVPQVRDPDRGRLTRENPGVAMDTAPDGTAYAAWHQARPEGGAEVVLSRSPDGGLTWSSPRVVAGAVKNAFIPSLAVGADGSVGVIWYDLRGDRSGDDPLTADVWFARSRDGGSTWSESHAAGPFDLSKAALVDGTYFLGDYFGLAALPDGSFGATFAMSPPLSRNGPSDVYFERLPVTGSGTTTKRPAATLHLTMRHRVRAGRRVRLRLRVSARGALVPGALVRVAGRRVRTGRRGLARLRVRFPRAGRVTATASKPGFATARVRLRVLAPRRSR